MVITANNFPAGLRARRNTAHWRQWVRSAAIAAALAGCAVTVLAATELASEPIFGRSSDVKPNIMVLMDTSNSMTWTHMPDGMERPRPASVLSSDTTHPKFRQPYGYKSHLCNSLYYDPGRMYVLPKDYLGGSLPLPSFNAAPYNYFQDTLGEPPAGVTAAGTVDLATQFRAHDSNTVSNKAYSAPDPAQAAYYFEWVPSNASLAAQAYFDSLTSANKSIICWGHPTVNYTLTDDVGGTQGTLWTPTGQTSLGAGRWVRRLVVDAAQQQNFAIWYTYYRTRLAMAKSAMARAMDNLDARYRLGFITALPGLPLSGEFPPALTLSDYAVKPGRFLEVNTFTGTHRADWYTTLKSQTAEGTSPMREALARVGRYYGGKEDSINQGMPATGDKDPIIDACQRNYTIMTTDGYWNVNHELIGGGPLRLDGTTRVGNQDGGATYTSDDGLVPRGAYEGKAGALPATVEETRTNTFRIVDCASATVNRMWTSQTIETTTNTYLNQYVTGGGGIWVQKREIRNEQRTWKVRRTDLQNQMRTNSFVERRRQHTARLNENTVVVPHCNAPYNTAPYSNCTANDTTVSSNNPNCQATSGAAPEWLHTVCLPVVITAGVQQCSAGATLPPGQTCVENVPVVYNNTLVAGSLCPFNNPASAGNGWVSRNCTVEDEQITNVATCQPNLNQASGNRTCASIDTGWLPSPLANPPQAIACTKQNPSLPPHVFVDCRGICPAGQTCQGNGDPVPICPFTVGSNGEEICNTITTPVAVAPGTCVAQSPTAANGYTTINCDTMTTPQVTVDSCEGLAQPATADNAWTTTHCETVDNGPGKQLQHAVNVTRSTRYGSGTPVTTTEADTGWQWLTGDVPTSPLPQYPFQPVIPNLGQHVRDVMGMPHALACIAAEQLPENASPGPLVRTRAWEEVGTVVEAPSFNSLADVAQYYYATDLRPDMADTVPSGGTEWYSDKVPNQHMTTFVVGLGVSGEVKYQENYLTAEIQGMPTNCTPGTLDFPRIRNGFCAWPQWPPLTSNGTENTVAINQGNLRSIDDFFHAAVNGRGRYFNANNPDTLVGALSGALSLIDVSTAFGAGAGLPPRANPQDRYQSSYDTKLWFGDLVKAPLLMGGTPYWSASSKLATMVGEACDDRNIWVARYTGTAPSKHPFAWDTTTCTGNVALPDLPGPLKAMFQSQHNSIVAQLTQYPEMTNGAGGTVDQRDQVTPQSLINYIRGQKQHEGFEPNVSGKLFRKRLNTAGAHAPLGDIIGSRPVVVGAPSHRYTDPTYASFMAANANRRELVYVGSNGGMLHAFYTDNLETSGQDNTAGREAWAFVPQTVARDLWVLADTNYAGKKRYFVDGSPVVRDVKRPDGVWMTLLVGGFNAGGRGYYALDITNPADPKPLWEINQDSPVVGQHVGYSFGQPKIAKLKNGTWAVVFASGHRTESDSGLSGKGKLFVVNATTGALISALDTGVGSETDPAGLAHVTDWVVGVDREHRFAQVYGGDLLGNVWRFDLDKDDPDDFSVAKLAVLTDSTNNAQPLPVTTALEAGLVEGQRMVFVGTGRLLGGNDHLSTRQHSVFGLYDRLTQPLPAGSTVHAPITRNELVKIKAVEASDPDVALTEASPGFECAMPSGVSCDPADPGWVVDLVTQGEHVNIPMVRIGRNLVVATNEPRLASCALGARSRLYQINIESGKPVKSPILLSAYQPVVGFTAYANEHGDPRVDVSFAQDPEDVPNSDDCIKFPGGVNCRAQNPGTPSELNRLSWRELVGN